MSLEQSPFGKLLEAADTLDILACNIHNLGVWLAVYLRVADGTEEFHG